MSICQGNRSLSRFVFGLGLLVIGVVVLLDNLHVIEGRDYFRYWPVLLIVWGLAKLADPRRPGGRFFGFIILGTGVVLLLENLGTIAWNVWDLWPLILVLIGLSMVWETIHGRSHGSRGMRGRLHAAAGVESGQVVRDEEAVTSSESTVDIHTFMGSNKRVVTTQDFRGGKVHVSMGACELDLRQSSIAGSEATLDVHAVMGGIEIRVPEDWTVIARTNAVLGGVEDSTHQPAPGASKTLVITGEAILGGIEVRN